MANEVRRLAPAYFVQTPNFWFPVEPHYQSLLFHWLPEQVRMRLLLWKSFGYVSRATNVGEAMAKVQYAACLDHRQMQFLFPDAAMERERFMGLTKSLMAVRTSPTTV